MICYEEDKLQCAYISTQTKKRCDRIATHCCGNKAYCERHNQLAIRDRANNAPLTKKEQQK
jgi:hypothetical protein